MNGKTWLGVILMTLVVFSVTLQILQMGHFKRQGQRFTHQDGIELCQPMPISP